MGSEHENTYTNQFSRLGNKPESVSDCDVDIIERLVVERYIEKKKYRKISLKAYFMDYD